jgi:hypothetical protein
MALRIRQGAAVACNAGNGGAPVKAEDLAAAPPEVLADARRLAAKMADGHQPKADDITGQLVALYLAAKANAEMVVFNPGGWGWAPMEKMADWDSILKCIKATLSDLGLKSVLIVHRRTAHGWRGTMGELASQLELSRAKDKELAARVSFLTSHLPGLKVILTGESNGAAMSEKTMEHLRQNQRVYTIQTGTPFWRPSQPSPRSLIINHNGTEPDRFSQGDWGHIIWANIKSLFGKYKGSQGNILLYIGAPGHVYNWDYPLVRQRIGQFLKEKLANS